MAESLTPQQLNAARTFYQEACWSLDKIAGYFNVPRDYLAEKGIGEQAAQQPNLGMELLPRPLPQPKAKKPVSRERAREIARLEKIARGLGFDSFYQYQKACAEKRKQIPDNAHFSELVVARMKHFGISQPYLSRVTGINRNSLQTYCSGRVYPGAEVRDTILDALGLLPRSDSEYMSGVYSKLGLLFLAGAEVQRK